MRSRKPPTSFDLREKRSCSSIQGSSRVFSSLFSSSRWTLLTLLFSSVFLSFSQRQDHQVRLVSRLASPRLPRSNDLTFPFFLPSHSDEDLETLLDRSPAAFARNTGWKSSEKDETAASSSKNAGTTFTVFENARDDVNDGLARMKQ